MNRYLRSIFTHDHYSGYGPRDRNPVYTARSATGVVFRIERHLWQIPTYHWAWSATPVDGGTALYGDNLEEIALQLGYAGEE